MEEYKGYKIEIHWNQECFSWLYDIYPQGGKYAVARNWETFDFESQCLEAAKKRINEFVLAAN